MPTTVAPAPVSPVGTTVAAGSAGVTLASNPTTLNILSTTGFSSGGGYAAIPALNATVQYTGVNTGAGLLIGLTVVGGSGTLLLGMAVVGLPVFTMMTNGDQVNQNSLCQEASPGAEPYVTLTLLLNYIFGTAVGLAALLGSNNTWTGTNTFDSLVNWTRIYGRPTVKLTDANHTIDLGQGTTFSCAQPAAARTIILRDPAIGGTPQPNEGEAMIASRVSSGAYDIVIENGSGSVVATMPASTRATVVAQYLDLNDGLGLQWHVTGGFAFTAGLGA